MITLSPICPRLVPGLLACSRTQATQPEGPHFCEHGWSTVLGKTGSVLDARLDAAICDDLTVRVSMMCPCRFPAPTAQVDTSLSNQGDYMFNKVPHDFIKLLEKATKAGTAKSAVVYVAKEFPDWKKTVLAKLRSRHGAGKLPLVSQEDMKANRKPLRSGRKS